MFDAFGERASVFDAFGERAAVFDAFGERAICMYMYFNSAALARGMYELSHVLLWVLSMCCVWSVVLL